MLSTTLPTWVGGRGTQSGWVVQNHRRNNDQVKFQHIRDATQDVVFKGLVGAGLRGNLYTPQTVLNYKVLKGQELNE